MNLFILFYLSLCLIGFGLSAPTWIYPVLSIFLTGIYFLFNDKKTQKEPEKTKNDTNDAPSSQEKERYEKELQMAKKVQQGLLSVESPEIDGITIASLCISADNVGGDFYTFINKDGRSLVPRKVTPGVIKYIDKRDNYLGIAIGDVAGHGISAALVMALSSVVLRKLGKATQSPSATLRQANDDICKYIANSEIGYVTVFYCVLDIETKLLSYAKAGHVPALLIRNDGEIETLSGDGVFLGMFEKEEYEEKEVQLYPKDRVVFYTDGITEVRNEHNEQFGLERLTQLFSTNKEKSAEALKKIVFSDVSTFSRGVPLKDDQTLVILEIDA